MRGEIGRKTADWGISVKSVEIRDVAIPVALQDAMSRQAQAEREKQARVILGSAEAAIAGKFVEAAMTYADHPAALQLRAMNIIYETTKERGATILIPTSMVDSMNPVVALALAGQQAAPQKTERAAAAVSQRRERPCARLSKQATHKGFPKASMPNAIKQPVTPPNLPEAPPFLMCNDKIGERTIDHDNECFAARRNASARRVDSGGKRRSAERPDKR